MKISVLGTGAFSIIVVISLAWCTAGGKYKANEETRELCKKDGGIHVYRKISLDEGRFPTVIPDQENSRSWIKQGLIYEKYSYNDTFTYETIHGYTLYRHRTVITDVSDNSVIGEMIYYLRQGSPESPGMSCPENVSNEKLINAIFSQKGEVTDPYPQCLQADVEKIHLMPTQQATLLKDNVPYNRDTLPDNNAIWQRGINCDERTKIDRWYDKTGANSIGLVGTRLLFFRADGKRCQTLAMPDSEKISCDENGITVLGFKKKPGDPAFLMQRFNKTGAMETEVEIAPIFSGKLTNYRETDNSIEIGTANFNDNKFAKCFMANAQKTTADSSINRKRLGPPDMSFGYSFCETN